MFNEDNCRRDSTQHIPATAEKIKNYGKLKLSYITKTSLNIEPFEKCSYNNFETFEKLKYRLSTCTVL